MSGSNSFETNAVMSASQNNTYNESEALILTQEEVDEQIRNSIAPFTRQKEDLTRLIQGMFSAHQPNLSPRAGTSDSFSTAGPSPGMMTGGTGTSPGNGQNGNCLILHGISVREIFAMKYLFSLHFATIYRIIPLFLVQICTYIVDLRFYFIPKKTDCNDGEICDLLYPSKS